WACSRWAPCVPLATWLSHDTASSRRSSCSAWRWVLARLLGRVSSDWVATSWHGGEATQWRSGTTSVAGGSLLALPCGRSAVLGKALLRHRGVSDGVMEARMMGMAEGQVSMGLWPTAERKAVGQWRGLVPPRMATSG